MELPQFSTKPLITFYVRYLKFHKISLWRSLSSTDEVHLIVNWSVPRQADRQLCLQSSTRYFHHIWWMLQHYVGAIGVAAWSDCFILLVISNGRSKLLAIDYVHSYHRIKVLHAGEWWIMVWCIRYSQGFVVFFFFVVMLYFPVDWCDSLFHILCGYFTGTGVIIRLPQGQWHNPKRISANSSGTKQQSVQNYWPFMANDN